MDGAKTQTVAYDDDIKAAMRKASVTPPQTIDVTLPQRVTLPSEGFVRQPVVLSIFGVSRSTLWRWIAAKRFPRPYKLSPGTSAWDVTELRAYMARVKKPTK